MGGIGYAQVQKITYNVAVLGKQGVVVPVPGLVSVLLPSGNAVLING